jgi:hypothetical protein
MAEYTMELWEVVEIETDIGLNDYPIFDEGYRESLNNKIIEHYYNREIGMETISMFRQQLRKKMNEIMPYWNQQYLASQIEFDPLKTISVKTITGSDGETTVAGEGENTSTSNSKSRAVASSLPQVMLSGNGDYAESAQDNVSETSATGSNNETQTTNSTGNVDSETSGYQGSAAILIAEYRATLVNTDMDVINQLDTLFMGIWGSTDSYIERGYPRYGYFGHYGISI